ncbi:MAG TPA: DUF742 domain-containing protein [Acidimicrobiales bacterium]|nr:DUF742 domain-containing protein [Acidimicrobiales bacterium]
MNRDERDPRVVPVYALTRGRTRSVGRDLPWETLLTATADGIASLSKLRFEQARIVSFCRRPVSVAEVAAELGVPLGVARVLVSDLYAENFLVVHVPTFTRTGRPRTEILERLLTGLRTR